MSNNDSNNDSNHEEKGEEKGAEDVAGNVAENVAKQAAKLAAKPVAKQVADHLSHPNVSGYIATTKKRASGNRKLESIHKDGNMLREKSEMLKNLARLQEYIAIDVSKLKEIATIKANTNATPLTSDIADFISKTYDIVQSYDKNNPQQFSSPYMSMLQYETKLNIIRQTMEQLRLNYEKVYKEFKQAYEITRRNPRVDKIKVYRIAIVLKDIVEEYYQTVILYILHEQLIRKFWSAPTSKSEEKYGEYMEQIAKQQAPNEDAQQYEYAKLYGSALIELFFSRMMYKAASNDAVAVTNLGNGNVANERNDKALGKRFIVPGRGRIRINNSESSGENNGENNSSNEND